jgi:regulator of PEP synthase PpsR (kinase-PPPase family)
LIWVFLGEKMSEIQRYDIPIPLVNYVQLIRNRKSPYYDVVQFLLKEMEMHLEKGEASETVYTINPRILQEEIEERMKNEKLTTVNVCRTILALLYGSKLREDEDFYVTTTSSGRRNYHIKVNTRTLTSMSRLL